MVTLQSGFDVVGPSTPGGYPITCYFSVLIRAAVVQDQLLAFGFADFALGDACILFL